MELLVMSEIGSLLRFALVVVGLVYLVTQASITSSLRVALLSLFKTNIVAQMFLSTFLYCRACVGFWVGLVVGFFGLYAWHSWFLEPAVVGMALGALWKSDEQADIIFGLEAQRWDQIGWTVDESK